jgi:hypothetical protein
MKSEFNSLALNQTLFKKSLIFGQGFQDGQQSYLDETVNDNWLVFVNGKTKIPVVNSDLKELYTIGKMYYHDLLVGMPSTGGYIRYSLAITENEYLILAEVQLDNSQEDYAEEIAVFMWINRMPPYMFKNGELTIQKIAKELLMSHFTVFMGLENPRAIFERIEIDFEEKNSVLRETITEFIDIVESNKISIKTISKEVKEIMEMMDDLSEDDVELPE